MRYTIDPSEYSFVTVAIINPVLSRILEDYYTELKQETSFVKINGDKIKFGFIGKHILPENENDILDALLFELLEFDEDNKTLSTKIQEKVNDILVEMKFAKFVAGDVSFAEDEFDPEYEFEVYTYKSGKNFTSTIRDDGSFYDEFVGYDMPFDFE